MKYVQNFCLFCVLLSCSGAMVACSNEDFTEPMIDNLGHHTIPMELLGDVIRFAPQSDSLQLPTKAEAASSWSNGDKIYIAFFNGSNIISGEAVYNSSSGWSVSYDGALSVGTNLKCEARYFVNASCSSAVIFINSQTEIYEDVNATYSYSNGTLTVQATLSPKTGRIRFTGGAETKIHITGITRFRTFVPATNTFATTSTAVLATVASSGYTPYIYGIFPESETNLGIIYAEDAFTRICTSDILAAGASGYMAIPSENSHNNWRSGLFLTVKGVEFKCIPVAGDSDGFFLVGETEVTEELYYKVVGKSSTSQLPISDITYSDILVFIEKLNSETKLTFSLPTKSQWTFAAKGGRKSRMYMYSGSSTPDDVAWYSGNCSSKQIVKTKAPNELGIYDMSGNVDEFTVTQADTLYSYSQYRCGGSYKTTASDLIGVSALYFTSDVMYSCPYAGFRLILTL